MKIAIFLKLLAVSQAFVVVLEQDKCSEMMFHLCHDVGQNATAAAECIVAHEAELEPVCGDRVKCFVDQYNDCHTAATEDERFACLELHQKELEKECPMLDCELKTHELCGNESSPLSFLRCTVEHGQELKTVCHPPKEVTEEMAAMEKAVEATMEIVEGANKCREEIQSLCSNATTPSSLLLCLEANEAALGSVCGKQFVCGVEEHKLCGLNATQHDWFACLEKNEAQLAGVCPNVACEVTVFDLCGSSPNFLVCLRDHKDEIAKVCHHPSAEQAESEDVALIDLETVEVPEEEENTEDETAAAAEEETPASVEDETAPSAEEETVENVQEDEKDEQEEDEDDEQAQADEIEAILTE